MEDLSVDLNNSDVETTYDMDGDQLDVESKSSSATGKKRGTLWVILLTFPKIANVEAILEISGLAHMN
ncbi:hypothetical protein Tco_0578007 [Tanacetum coccineum]